MDATEVARRDLEAWREGVWGERLDDDGFFVGLVRRLVADDDFLGHLRRVHEAAGDELDALVNECNRDDNLPEVRRHDDLGRPREEVVFHPAHHAVGRVFWASGVLSVLGGEAAEVRSGALAYLLDRHGEAGHACPVACTAGAIKLLQRVGSDDQRRRFLPALLENDYDRRLHAAQFVTEVQGGSDVGLNSVRAVPDPDRPGSYRIHGEKWFCSVADAGLFVVSARLEGAPEGTRGLGLFLVPRHVDGAPNGFQLRRLKTKLGTRSMPTGEIEFDGALGEPIGSPGDGFRNLVGIVLDTSRVHNALAACGLMRRAFVEGRQFAAHRRAFEHRILDYPAVQSLVAGMRVRAMAALASTFRILEQSDRLAVGPSDDLAAARRIGVMINKYWTALAATATARDGIELLGGNGTIEDFSVLPRLYRDAIVIESWEGTHNTLCAQVLRDFVVRGLHRSWLDELERDVERIGDAAAVARPMVDDLARRIGRLLEADPPTQAAWIRDVVDRMCIAADVVALADQVAWEKRERVDSGVADALALYLLRNVDRVAPMDSPDRVRLERDLATRG